MDDLGAALQSFLAQPGAMEQMEAMAKQLGLGNAAQPGEQAPLPVLPGDLGGLSPELMTKLLGALGQSGDSATDGLFESLRPLFPEEKREKLDRAARAMRLMRTARAVSGALGTIEL